MFHFLILFYSQDDVSTYVIDGVLENIRIGMEVGIDNITVLGNSSPVLRNRLAHLEQGMRKNQLYICI